MKSIEKNLPKIIKYLKSCGLTEQEIKGYFEFDFKSNVPYKKKILN